MRSRNRRCEPRSPGDVISPDRSAAKNRLDVRDRRIDSHARAALNPPLGLSQNQVSKRDARQAMARPCSRAAERSAFKNACAARDFELSRQAVLSLKQRGNGVQIARLRRHSAPDRFSSSPTTPASCTTSESKSTPGRPGTTPAIGRTAFAGASAEACWCSRCLNGGVQPLRFRVAARSSNSLTSSVAASIRSTSSFADSSLGAGSGRSSPKFNGLSGLGLDAILSLGRNVGNQFDRADGNSVTVN